MVVAKLAIILYVYVTHMHAIQLELYIRNARIFSTPHRDCNGVLCKSDYLYLNILLLIHSFAPLPIRSSPIRRM